MLVKPLSISLMHFHVLRVSKHFLCFQNELQEFNNLATNEKVIRQIKMLTLKYVYKPNENDNGKRKLYLYLLLLSGIK